MTNSFGEFENAKLFFLIGTNMTEAHPVASYYVKRAKLKGAKIIVADPRYHALAKKADIYAQIKVGSDVAFLNGIMNVLITENLYDKKFVEENTEGFEDLKAVVMKYTPEKAAEISGVPADQIREIARTMARVKPGMLCYTLGITEHTCGKNNVIQHPISRCFLETSGWNLRELILSAARITCRAHAIWVLFQTYIPDTRL